MDFVYALTTGDLDSNDLEGVYTNKELAITEAAAIMRFLDSYRWKLVHDDPLLMEWQAARQYIQIHKIKLNIKLFP